MSLQMVNPNANSISVDALEINVRAAISLKELLKTNLGPKGKLKMLVSGAGDLTLTKDGAVLLKQMQIEHPTACVIARNAAAQDQISGDGSTSLVLFIGELLQKSAQLVADGVHPRNISDGIELGRKDALRFLEHFAKDVSEDLVKDREFICAVASSSLRTKLPRAEADHLTGIVVDSVMSIRREGRETDLFMVEVVTMEHKSVLDSVLVDGLVLDHGFRHPQMAKISKNCYLLILNVSLEYEKTEVNSQFYFNNADQRAEMVSAERNKVNSRIDTIVALKQKVCSKDKTASFVVINQKGIDPLSLDRLNKNGIVALRRAKRRNMERLSLAFGGKAMNSTENLSEDCLGFAGSVTEKILGEERFTFVEGAKEPRSVTVLLRGNSKHILVQAKEALRDGLRAVKFAVDDRKVVPGAGSFELACAKHLETEIKNEKYGKSANGVKAFAEALMAIPKVLAQNSGLNMIESVRKLEEASNKTKSAVGLNLEDGEPMSPEDEGVWDNYRAKRQFLQLGAVMAENLMVVDEVIRAGKVDRS